MRFRWVWSDTWCNIQSILGSGAKDFRFQIRFWIETSVRKRKKCISGFMSPGKKQSQQTRWSKQAVCLLLHGFKNCACLWQWNTNLVWLGLNQTWSWSWSCSVLDLILTTVLVKVNLRHSPVCLKDKQARNQPGGAAEKHTYRHLNHQCSHSWWCSTGLAGRSEKEADYCRCTHLLP